MTVNFINERHCRIVFFQDGKTWDEPMPFASLDAALDYCEDVLDVEMQAEEANVIDAFTGEVIAHCASDVNEYYEPTDIDDDMGFDPYEGCFTYDC